MFAVDSLGTTSRSQTTSLKALVLNASYEPLRIVTWQKALILWFQDKVEILEYHKKFVRSVSTTFELPSVMRMKKYVKPKRIDGVRFCRENVYIRDLYTCQYCRIKFAAKDLTIDHVIPASHGGPKNWTNIVTACRKCNQIKANRTPDMANMPLFKPARMPSWLPVLEHEVPVDTRPANWLEYLRFGK
jgi:5-methylcytosine-specific restriction endonuclease McrA